MYQKEPFIDLFTFLMNDLFIYVYIIRIEDKKLSVKEIFFLMLTLFTFLLLYFFCITN